LRSVGEVRDWAQSSNVKAKTNGGKKMKDVADRPSKKWWKALDDVSKNAIMTLFERDVDSVKIAYTDEDGVPVRTERVHWVDLGTWGLEDDPVLWFHVGKKLKDGRCKRVAVTWRFDGFTDATIT
jgi:hypothetical protein